MTTKKFVSVNLTEQARDELRAAVPALTTAVGQRISMSDVLIQSLRTARQHEAELIAALRGEVAE